MAHWHNAGASSWDRSYSRRPCVPQSVVVELRRSGSDWKILDARGYDVFSGTVYTACNCSSHLTDGNGSNSKAGVVFLSHLLFV